MAIAPATFAQHPLGKRPTGWKSHRNHYVILSYEKDSSGALVFTYKEAFTPAQSRAITSFSDLTLATKQATGPILDLEVYADCFLEVWLNPLQNMRWSLVYDAITTKQDFSNYYFELKYKDGNDLYDRASFPTDVIPLVVRFGAKHNYPPVQPTLHGFSLNIELVHATGKPTPLTIDPDIQNPKV